MIILIKKEETAVFMLCILVCFFASTVGAVCGIGGGIIIKPVLETFRILEVPALQFMSGCAVWSMSAYSVIKGRGSKETQAEPGSRTMLALGAAMGGAVGRKLFAIALQMSENSGQVGRIQAGGLLIITVGTLFYTLYKEKIRTIHIVNYGVCVLIGGILGMLSAFLGIGGGPVNLVVLFFFFSMSTKAAVESSLYIIFFSQSISLFLTILSGVGNVDFLMLILMCGGGIAGGICGRSLNKKMSDKTVDKLFIVLMVMLIGICIYNLK